MTYRILCLFIIVSCGFSIPLSAATYTPEGDMIGSMKSYIVRRNDNLYAIARKFDIGIVELLSANPGVDPWEPEEGRKLTITNMHVLPPVRSGIVLNLSELRLFYFAGDKIMTFPIGIGREGWETPLGETVIVKKRKDPVWIPPASVREENLNLPDMIPAGPDNPMGSYALNLGWASYAIHGTNRPYGIGKRSSHGCIRLYPEDIEVLFNAVSIDTAVTIIDTSYKLGWRDDILYLEATPTQQQADIIAKYKRPFPNDIAEIPDIVRSMAGNDGHIDWYAVKEAMAKRNGIPTPVARIKK